MKSWGELGRAGGFCERSHLQAVYSTLKYKRGIKVKWNCRQSRARSTLGSCSWLCHILTDVSRNSLKSYSSLIHRRLRFDTEDRQVRHCRTRNTLNRYITCPACHVQGTKNQPWPARTMSVDRELILVRIKRLRLARIGNAPDQGTQKISETCQEVVIWCLSESQHEEIDWVLISHSSVARGIMECCECRHSCSENILFTRSRLWMRPAVSVSFCNLPSPVPEINHLTHLICLSASCMGLGSSSLKQGLR